MPNECYARKAWQALHGSAPCLWRRGNRELVRAVGDCSSIDAVVSDSGHCAVAPVRFQQRDMPASALRSLPLRGKSGNVDDGIRAGRECSVFVNPEASLALLAQMSALSLARRWAGSRWRRGESAVYRRDISARSHPPDTEVPSAA